MPDPCRIWCGGLPSDISELELYEEFSKHGNVITVAIRSSVRDTFAFIEMDHLGAELAVYAMNGAPLWGSPHLNVRIANENQSHRPPDIHINRPQRPVRLVVSRSGEVEHGHGGHAIDSSRDFPRRTSWCLNYWDPFDLWTDCQPDFDRRIRHCAWRGPGLGQDQELKGYCENSKRPRLSSHFGFHRISHSLHEGLRRESTWSLGDGDGGDQRHRSPRRSRRNRFEPQSDSQSRISSPAPPPPPSSSEHALYDAGAIEWRAKHLAITVENIPWDMGWMELKNLGRMYGFVAHARTFKEGSINVGALEFSKKEVVERAREGLDGQMISGAKAPLRVRLGAPPEALTLKGSSVAFGRRPQG